MRFRIPRFTALLSALIMCGGVWSATYAYGAESAMYTPQTAQQAAQNCPNPLSPGVTFGGTTIAVVLLKGPEGGFIHEVRAHTNFEIGNCPPIKGEISYRLEIKVRRGLKFRWIPVGTLEKKDVSNLPPGTKFGMTSRRHCNPHGHASFRVYVHAAAGINGDGTPSPPETRYLPTPKGKYKACR